MHRIFERFPESRVLFTRVSGDDMDSPKFRAHILRITEGVDNMISLMDDSRVLLKEVEHLANQHAAVDGMKARYITVSIIDRDRLHNNLVCDRNHVSAS